METAALFTLASLALAGGMLAYLHWTRRLSAREHRALNSCEERLVRVRDSLEGTATGLQETRAKFGRKADAVYAEAKLNEAISELFSLQERKKRVQALAQR